MFTQVKIMLTLAVIFVVLACLPLSATIIDVPDDYSTIQAGIDASSDGDTVRVASDTYVENINFSGKNIVVGSWFLDDGDTSFISSTIIDGNQSGRVVSFLNGEDNSAVITGFTIQNGLADHGGGIYCNYSSPTINNNTISGNSASQTGGGISCNYSSPTISYNTINGNSADLNGGGGIFCFESSPTINNNTISGNSTRDGGGINCWYSNPTISNNTISGNSANQWGGGIYCNHSSPTINYNTINGNSAGFNGGGISCWDSSPIINFNTISGNSANQWGGGIYCQDSSPVITNTILWGDSATYSGPEIYLYGPSSPVITYCDVQGGWAGEGNIDCDPMFCDPENGNFYLHYSSCCVGAGEGGVDIGAFGIGCGLINIPADYETIQEGIDACFDGDIVRVASGTYVENINFSGKNIVVSSWFLDDGDTSFISSTIIDGGVSGSVVRFVNGEDNTAIITGFTIQNGNANYGGGIHCLNSSPTINYNTISGNSALWGSGICCSEYSNPTINYNTISGNSGGDYGGGIHCNHSSPTINYNTISGNSADNYGGGICCEVNSSPTITNNTISGNSASSGGGICCWYSSPVITNTIFWGDSASTGPEIYLYESSPVITYCDIQGGWAGEGNIDCDPIFCDPESGNFYLNAASCCVGAGEGGVDIGAFGIGCGYIINIPADYETIQEGIDASYDSDTVRVASGTYYENIDFSGKNIVVGSWFLDAGDTSFISSTIIDGNQSGSVVSFGNGEDNSAVITGFTIQNGPASWGGGIHCNHSSPTINYNNISGNSATAKGGGIYCVDSSPTISNNTISGNSAYDGGGIYCVDSSPAISNNTISENSATYMGGGIGCVYSNPTISNNTISENSATYSGGGIYCDNYNPTISNNTISGNSATHMGGGIHCNYSSPTISNNTISGNSTSYGGGIYCWYSSPVITNTIFWGDSAPNGPEIYLVGGSPVITYCDVQGGWAGEGNIDCDPMFCDPESGNFYLHAASCCVGAGEGGVDIGAFGIGCVYIINIPADYETIQEGIDASFDGDTVRVASGTYVENIDFSGKNIVVGSWFLDDGDTSFISSTIIDGGASGSVVTFENGEDNTAIITGFTIQNGLADHGGGIACDNNSNPTITDNTISGNSATVYGGGIYCNDSSPTINYNTISGNSAGYGGGIRCYNSSSTISDNTISGNSVDHHGGGIYCVDSTPTINYNTISGNTAGYNGGGINCSNSSPVITNTIFWGDSAPDGPEIYLIGGSPVIIYCDIQGGWAGEGNIDADPYFCFSDTAYYWLAENSPCVGAGCDSLGNPDSTINIGAFDIGCEEHLDISDNNTLMPYNFTLSQNYPNPFNPTTTISFTIEHPQHVTLKVYDLLGREVQTLINENKQAGLHTVTFDASDLSSGIYFYRLQAGDMAESKRMVLLK